MGCSCDPSNGEVEARASGTQGQPQPHREWNQNGIHETLSQKNQANRTALIRERGGDWTEAHPRLEEAVMARKGMEEPDSARALTSNTGE